MTRWLATATLVIAHVMNAQSLDERPLLGRVVVDGRVHAVYGIPGAASLGEAETERLSAVAFGGAAAFGVEADSGALVLLQGSHLRKAPSAAVVRGVAVSSDGNWLATASNGSVTTYRVVEGELKKVQNYDLAGKTLLNVSGGGLIVVGEEGSSAALPNDGSVVRTDQATGGVVIDRPGQGREVVYDGAAGAVTSLAVQGNRVWGARKTGLLEISESGVALHDGVAEDAIIRSLNEGVLLAERRDGLLLLVDVRQAPRSYVLPVLKGDNQ